jgi:UTP--glucose-1-phosphate uridylyltransferase
MIKKVRKAVFPVAGLGTRFLPATKSIPKEMQPLVDKPLIQHAVEEALASGIEEMIFVNSPSKASLEKHFEVNEFLAENLNSGGKADLLEILSKTNIGADRLSTVIQELPLGFGHAVWCAKDLVGDEPFAIILPDDVVLSDKPCMKQMIEIYNEIGGNVVAVEDVPREHTMRYGILDVSSDDGRLAAVKGLVEKPKPEEAPSTLSIIGRYILQPEVFAWLDRKEKGKGGEIQLTDSMAKLIGAQPFHGLRFEGTRYDCGDKIGFLEANIAFALNDRLIGDRVYESLARLLEEYKTPHLRTVAS